jgi:hypothetical protein
MPIGLKMKGLSPLLYHMYFIVGLTEMVLQLGIIVEVLGSIPSGTYFLLRKLFYHH